MRILRPLLMLLFVLLLIAGAASVRARESTMDSVRTVDNIAAESSANLLANPSFEGEYSTYVPPPPGHPDCDTGICFSVQIADGWTPWWKTSQPSANPPLHNPEYKPAELWHVPKRVWDGARAQQYFSFSSTHRAGFYQRVRVDSGEDYCFRIWGQSWSSNNDDFPPTSDSILEQRIGIDPNGGEDWQSPDVVWGGFLQQYDEYGLFNVCTTAQANHLTVFTYSEPKYAVKHNDVYWDNAQLIKDDGVPLELVVEESEIDFLADVDHPLEMDYTIKIGLPQGLGFGWEAQVFAGDTFTPTLSADTGNAGDNLIVTVNSDTLALGTYFAEIKIFGVPGLPGSPQTITVKLEVADLTNYYIPYIVSD